MMQIYKQIGNCTADINLNHCYTGFVKPLLSRKFVVVLQAYL